MQSNQLKEFFTDVFLFEGMEASDLDQLSAISDIKTFKKNRYIYKQGDKVEYLFFLKKGVITIGNTTEDGKEVLKSILHPKSLFGELCLMGQTERINYAKILSDEAECVVIKVDDLNTFLLSHPLLQRRILKYMGERLLYMERKIESLILKDARSRIIDFIKRNAQRSGRQVGYETLFKHYMTQQDIANITGTSRQTVTSVLNELKNANQIYFNRKSILVRDLERFGESV